MRPLQRQKDLNAPVSTTFRLRPPPLITFPTPGLGDSIIDVPIRNLDY